MENKLFRKTALETVASPERLNEFIQITNPGIWAIVTGLFVLICAIVIWGFTGTIPNTVKVKGIVFTHQGVISIIPPHTGKISQLNVKKGDYIQKGDALAVIKQENNYTKIHSPVTGTVLHTINKHHNTTPNETIASVINEGENTELKTIISYIPSSTAKRLKNNMTVEVSPFFAPREEYGYMYGHIAKIDTFPVSEDEIIRALGKKEYVANILPEGDFVRMDIILENDAKSKNNIKWSNKKGEDLDIPIGTQVNIQVVTKVYKPYELIFK